MDYLRRLVSAALVAGAISGLAAFGLQHVMVEPRLLKAETYEEAALRAQPEDAHAAHDWEPSDGFERTAYTGISTMITGIGYAALLLGAAATLDVRLGTVIATAIGLWLFIDSRLGWRQRIVGAAIVLVPHLIGAPIARGASVVPLQLARQFAIALVASSAMFWLLIGMVGGYCAERRLA